MLDLTMPGNPRYQPESLKRFFGHDNLARALVEVELAGMRTLGDLGAIPETAMAELTPAIGKKLLAITTTEMDRVESEETEYGKATRHDIRALVRIMQAIMPEPLKQWVHVLFTSYDVIDTARALGFKRAHEEVVEPEAEAVLREFVAYARRYARMTQVGRTHVQHALPITVGFWISTVLGRMLTNVRQMNMYADGLHGKISGAVGAYNAQVGLGFYKDRNGKTFEEKVLARLGLHPAPISTQIVPPEPLAYYLFSCTMMSAALGQYGLDGRHLMSTDVEELSEPFEEGQVGSSTMAHKRNPVTLENVQGMWEGSRAEFGKVFATLLSENQRDLVGSSILRDLPIIVIRLVCQLERLLKRDKATGRTFIERVIPDYDACQRNLMKRGDILLAEPYYIALQAAGYPGDAHALINEHAMKVVRSETCTLGDAVGRIATIDQNVAEACANIPEDVWRVLQNSGEYTGDAACKTFQICDMVDVYLDGR